ncbi:hypothetical protein EIL63_0023040, partial [Salmonella enterica subsp. enterica serovar Java]
MNQTYTTADIIQAAQWIWNGGPWKPSVEPGMPPPPTAPQHHGNNIVAMIDLQLAIDDYTLTCEPSKQRKRLARLAAFREVYGYDQTYSVAAQRLGVTRQTVKQWADQCLITLTQYT